MRIDLSVWDLAEREYLEPPEGYGCDICGDGIGEGYPRLCIPCMAAQEGDRLHDEKVDEQCLNV
jgi:hypothetical protein